MTTEPFKMRLGRLSLLCSGMVGLLACGSGETPTTSVSSTVPGIKPAAGTYATAATGPYRLVLVVAPDRRTALAAFVVSCRTSPLPVHQGLSGADIPINGGEFLIDNADVRITGRVTGPMVMEGSLEAKSREASSCGLPTSATWTAQCGEPTGFRSLVIGGKSIPVGDGSCTP